MIIGVEIRPIAIGASGGILQLLKGVLSTLFNNYEKDTFFLFTTIYNDSVFEDLPDNVTKFTLPTVNFFQEVDRIAREEDIEVLFRSFPMADCLAFPLERQIFMIPDLQHEKFPEFFEPRVMRQRKVDFNRVLSGAGGIATLSQYTRKTIEQHPATKCRDVFISGPALQIEHKTVSRKDLEADEIQLIPKNKFFYFPANLWKHKNHKQVFLAFRKFLEETSEPVTLVLTGHQDGWTELSSEFNDLPIVHLGYVRSVFVQYLMQHAVSLVFFTLYEGFGIPLLEAFQAGTAVICSNTTSLPEVGGDAVIYGDPTNVDEITATMKRIFNDEQLRSELINKGKKRLDMFTWEKSAENLHAACKRIGKGLSQKVIEKPSIHSEDELPLVSIITPSLNQGQFLQRTIESVLTQDYPNIEYVVIDGGSNDGSVDILKSYGQRFKWVSEPDNGQAHAINKGLSLTKGTVLAYLNSDDVLYPGAVSAIVNHFIKNPSCDAVYGKADYLDKYDNKIGEYNTDVYSFERNMHDCCICQPGCFWRKQVTDAVGTFDECRNYAMDYDYWLRIDRSGGKIEHIHDVIAGSRLYDETKTLSGRDAFYQEIFEVCRKHGNYVSLNYYLGWWHYQLHEKNAMVSSVFKFFPFLYKWFAKIHHMFSNNKTTIFESFKQRIKAHIRTYAHRLYHKAACIRKKRKVKGFYLDNWLGPKAVIRTPTAAKTYHLAGTAPVDMCLRVKVSGDDSLNFSFSAGQYKKVNIAVKESIEQTIKLQFSSYIRDPVRRRLSLHVQSTDLFSECDLR